MGDCYSIQQERELQVHGRVQGGEPEQDQGARSESLRALKIRCRRF